jgi:uncharacterized protein YecE (DUF72 family)
MEFGSAPVLELGQIDFSLPREPDGNNVVLSQAKRPKESPRVYLGCAKWGRKEWIGKIYPQGTPETAFLEHYVRHYNSIELNATHYKIYTPAEIKKWTDKAKGRDFLFCPKFPQQISHYSSLTEIDGLTTAFLEGVLAFKDHLGPIFLQVSERFGPNRKEKLFNYLRSLPTDLSFFLEVRHPEWFSDPRENENLFQTLKDLGIGAVITDTAGRRDCAHMHLTTPKTFIRYVGNSLHPTDYSRIDQWVGRIKYWLDKGIEDIYFFMHMHNEATSPELTVYLVDKLNAACGLHLTKPHFITGAAGQASLF